MIASNSEPLLITMTPSAIDKIKRLIEAAQNPHLKLRIYIVGGGCSGFQYGFKLDDVVNTEDMCVDVDGISVLIAPLSLPYLQGATVDYVENLQGASFKVNNPNAETTCGCGSSFSLKECNKNKG